MLSLIAHVLVGLCLLSVGSAVALGAFLIGVVIGSIEAPFAHRPTKRQPLPRLVYDDSTRTRNA